jgi:hypothetical protein
LVPRWLPSTEQIMPIRINLLAEALVAEDLRRRDPVKRVIFFGAFLVVLALAWSSSLQLSIMISKHDLARVQSTIEERTDAWQKVLTSQKKVFDARAKLDSLQNLAASRFLEGNFLNALQRLNQNGVQLMRVRLEQSFVKTDAVPNKTNDTHVVFGHPAMTMEKIHVTLDARDSSSSPGDQINKFKDAISSQPYFKSGLNQANTVQLISLTPMQNNLDGKPFVLFTLTWDLPQQTPQNQ